MQKTYPTDHLPFLVQWRQVFPCHCHIWVSLICGQTTDSNSAGRLYFCQVDLAVACENEIEQKPPFDLTLFFFLFFFFFFAASKIINCYDPVHCKSYVFAPDVTFCIVRFSVAFTWVSNFLRTTEPSGECEYFLMLSYEFT